MNDRNALPNDAWGPDTRRILARIDDLHDANAHDSNALAYAAQLAQALATPAE